MSYWNRESSERKAKGLLFFCTAWSLPFVVAGTFRNLHGFCKRQFASRKGRFLYGNKAPFSSMRTCGFHKFNRTLTKTHVRIYEKCRNPDQIVRLHSLPRKCVIHVCSYLPRHIYLPLTLVLLSPDITCICKQCGSRSVGFWSGSALFVIQYVNSYQQTALSNLIGWQLEIGVASQFIQLDMG